MGRHSAPDDDAAGVVESPSAPAVAPSAVAVRSGRHARTDESAVAVASEVVDVPVTAEGDVASVPTATAEGDTAADADEAPASEAEPEPEAASEPKQRRESATRADLRLLREQPALRARCAAAAVVPFVLYAIVLIVIGAMSAFLLWVWIPTITAGAVVGGLLDAAHRRSERT